MKRNLIRICIIAIIVSIFSFSDWSFAAEGEAFDDLAWALNYAVSMLSWLWVFFAKLAWIFLTNKWVYWEVLSLDALFWRLWNVMKNIANFVLWFYFVYTVFKGLIKSKTDEITKKLKKTILWLLIAWVWIQASRFFTAAIIDVSTITLSAAWAFPSQVISESPYVEWAVVKSIEQMIGDKWKEISLFSKNAKASSFIETRQVDLDAPKDKEFLIDSLMPKPEDVAWPLYFIWFSILKTDVVTSVNTSSDKLAKATILNTIIQWWTTVVFAIEMLVLCVLALMRIIYLWMFIIIAPIAVLLRCIQKIDDKEILKLSFIKWVMTQINLRSFFINVFKPTIIVIWFWIAVIFVTMMNSVVIDYTCRTFDAKWAKLSCTKDPQSNVNADEGDQTYTTSIEDNLLEFTIAHAWKTLLELILSIVTVIIVYLVIEFAVKFWWWKDFVSQKIEKVQNWVKWLMESVPLVPVAWYDENGMPTTNFISAWKVFGLWSNSSLLEEKISHYQWKLNDVYKDQIGGVDSWFWDSNKVTLDSDKERAIAQAGVWLSSGWLKILEAKKTKIYELRDKNLKEGEWYGLRLNPEWNYRFWIEQFEKWLTDMNGKTWNITWKDANIWIEMVNRWNDPKNKDNKTLENLFKKDPRYIKAYADFFDLKNVKGWDDLKNRDISKKS